jgi:hypothetical protein
MQEEGEAERKLDVNYWVNVLLNRIGAEDLDPNIVVDDLRFPNEAAALRSNGFYLVRIDCPLAVRMARAQLVGGYVSIHGAEHESEWALDDWPDWDYRISERCLTIQPERLARHILGSLLMREFDSLP